MTKTIKSKLGRRRHRSRRAPGDGRNRSSKLDRKHVELRPPGEGWQEYKIEFVPKQPISDGLIRFKTSNKWSEGSRTAKIWRSVPYIDHMGFIHAITMRLWHCDANQLLATIASTVHKRLMKCICNRLHKKRGFTSGLLMQIALVYTITNHDSWLRRCLEMIRRKNLKGLRNFVYYKITHLDVNTRFLYDQAHYAASWFQSRMVKCPSRVKSKLKFCVDPFSLPLWNENRLHYDRALASWAKVFLGPWNDTLLKQWSPLGCRHASV